MKTKKNYVSYAAILIAAISIVLFFINGRRPDVRTPIPARGAVNDESLFFMRIYPELVVPTENALINGKTEIIDMDERISAIEDLFDNTLKDSVLIFRFSNFDCDVCIESTLSVMKEALVADTTGVFLLIDGMSTRDFRIKFKNLKIPFQTYFVRQDNLNLPLENKNIPFLFIMDRRTLSVNKIFLPSKDYTQPTRSYIRNVMPLIHD